MSYHVKKLIKQYSLVDLLEVTMFAKHPEYILAKNELDSRTYSNEELEMAKKGLQFRIAARNKPLPFIDKIYCLLAPFMVSKPTISGYSDIHELYEDQIEEYRYHNETKKVVELKKWQKRGRIFQLCLLSFFLVFWLYLKIC